MTANFTCLQKRLGNWPMASWTLRNWVGPILPEVSSTKSTCCIWSPHVACRLLRSRGPCSSQSKGIGSMSSRMSTFGRKEASFLFLIDRFPIPVSLHNTNHIFFPNHMLKLLAWYVLAYSLVWRAVWTARLLGDRTPIFNWRPYRIWILVWKWVQVIPGSTQTKTKDQPLLLSWQTCMSLLLQLCMLIAFLLLKISLSFENLR